MSGGVLVAGTAKRYANLAFAIRTNRFEQKTEQLDSILPIIARRPEPLVGSWPERIQNQEAAALEHQPLAETVHQPQLQLTPLMSFLLSGRRPGHGLSD